MQKEIQKIGKILLGEGVLTREVITAAIAKAGLKGSSLAILLEKCHHVSVAELAAFLAGDFDIPVIKDLRKIDLYDEAAKALPEKLARAYQLLPLARMGKILCIARGDYLNSAGIVAVRKETGLHLKIFQVEEPQLKVAIDRVYGGSQTPIPAPKNLQEDETRVIKSLPPSPSVSSIPLISIPTESRNDKSKTKQMVSVDPEEEVLLVEDSMEPSQGVLEALVVAPHEYGAAQKDHASELIRKFESTFLEETVLTAEPLS